MSTITYLKGDATEPVGEGTKIICHICNDIGVWGSGFVLALSRKWKEPENDYKKWYHSKDGFELGKIKLVPVKKYDEATRSEIVVCNMVAQHSIGIHCGVIPLRYEALRSCLNALADHITTTRNYFDGTISASVHMPRIGCCRAGGDWDEVEKIINETLITANIEVYVYDLIKEKR